MEYRRDIIRYKPHETHERELTPDEIVMFEKLACFLEQEENWTKLKRMCLYVGPNSSRVNGLRELLSRALKEELV